MTQSTAMTRIISLDLFAIFLLDINQLINVLKVQLGNLKVIATAKRRNQHSLQNYRIVTIDYLSFNCASAAERKTLCDSRAAEIVIAVLD